ncbi:conserved Plasmodium protein, unknown function [Plasmodium chabaudi chabaudi]|uniref:Uncharacterized protein n=1 Tax=Plasmodium chabaudi chabaudi TaxID=31271 RepID=A0A077YE24_PLACU|nr:conserved Plasmodium protein, unknown function [Plasmodium chabaudi chabaudi]SCM02909.1 conserved Plasmodium protein, unknown function [Plasmodium chabaudi chabaudi]VTZ66664.1 conserved Plasmodium protein, unknown function [Plasmodium chabaudi chabaudi]|eukprot:XP_743566.1 conserved Plasmodium protein, unknown function [Plasmodium chabaudi chabaudi]
MYKITNLRNCIPSNTILKNTLLLNPIGKINLPHLNAYNKINMNKGNIYRDGFNENKEFRELEKDSFMLFINNNTLIDLKKTFNEQSSKQVLLFWNRSPGARYPKKANNGARPDCRSLRKIRKRLKTGK